MSSADDGYFANAPIDVQIGIQAFWPESEWEHAAGVSKLESGWDAFALNDTTDGDHPCGSSLGMRDGVHIVSERSVGLFQINACNFPGWEWQRLYNVMHNCGTAHMLWDQRGWNPWYFSAQKLGLLS